MSSQFIEIIEWLDDAGDTLVHRFPVQDQEIKMGARLTVRENQVALFVNEGKAADLFRPGLYTLSTRNVPVLSTLRGWRHGFESPFKAEVYFFSTRLFSDRKWGTAQPVLARDRELGMVRLRAFGTYAMRLADARVFFAQVVGTRANTSMEDIEGQLRSLVLAGFSDALAESGIPVLDIAARCDDVAEAARRAVDHRFRDLGLELAHLVVESVSLPEDVQAAVDQRSRLGVMGSHLEAYTRLQAAEALTMAASAGGGAAGAGVGLGAGMAMGQILGQAATGAMAHGASLPTQGTVSASPGAPAGQPAAVARWTLHFGGRALGPLTDEAVRAMVLRGEVEASVPAWRPGAAGWAPLSSYDEFRALNPPPLPPGS
jgi:membrane protease subunit (stomatin/prohibitin family)